MADRLDPLNLPLRGSRLIEASAGTGKTWTIAALYLRLVLGHGGVAGPARALLPGEILVMTFTRAATRELADRIRQRLVEAAACFRGEAAAGDDFMARLLADVPAGDARSHAAHRLAMAAEAMDEAAVHTIDAWCQRMLREHAFDSGCLFDEELQADPAALRAEAVHDYWRQQVYPLDGEALARVLDVWSGVEKLAEDAGALVELPLPPRAGQGSLAECIARIDSDRLATLATLRQGWVERTTEMRAWLEAQWARKDCPIDKHKLGVSRGGRWLQALHDWAADPEIDLPDVKAGAQRLTALGVAEAFKPGQSAAIPACFEAFGALMAALDALPTPGPALRLHAAARVAARMAQLKASAGTFGFADMLQRLDEALDEARHGERARRLRQRIVDQYPAALVDEFQDTSPRQLSIFDRLYRIADDDPARLLLLIGDPKQAIYGFRGADIQSYLQARTATRGRHHVLGTNHRSTTALVAAVNHVFGTAEARGGAGAFQLRAADQEGEDDGAALPFVAVAARGRAERFVCGGSEWPALTLFVDDQGLNKADSRALYAALCAERIVTLLNDAGAAFVGDGAQPRPLRPADIAVLVRTGGEAAAVRQALQRRGVASVYLSDKDSVYASAEAADLLRLLQAVAAPREVALARAALASATMGLSLDELRALADDDEAFDARCDTLRQLQTVWQGQGVLAMLRRALHAFGLPARCLGAPDGERRLTNLLHLAELLQAASATAEGEQALMRWLGQQIADASAGRGGGDEQVLRLESDADLVQVVTVHKSKGLEYPLVFLPFAAHFRGRRSGDVLLLADGAGGRRLVLEPDAEDLAAAEAERLREDLRLLYVALTRARHGLWVGAAALCVGRAAEYIWHRSALGCLLTGPVARPRESLVADLRALAAGCAGIEVQALDPGAAAVPPLTRLRPRAAPLALLAAPAYSAAFDRDWAIASYSALVRELGAAPVAVTAAGAVQVHTVLDDEPAEAAPSPTAAAAPWHRFPRGALAGNFLHDQLEWLAGEGFALADSAALQQALLRRCERQGWGHRGDDVRRWLSEICSRPLPPLGAALSELPALVPELEFWFSSDGLGAAALDDLCRRHLLPGRPRPALPERELHGLFMGFADLVFEHGGRWWVLDYKSNALGAGDADYTAAALEASMLEHRYDVQAALYLLALHRLLKARLGAAYVPAQHLGGAVYLYLRGIHGPAGGCCHLAPPPALVEALDALLPAPGAEAAP
ncbi:RecBCD enzyme subunit RecB [Rubrivivax sp. A210]|uniref:exodeoxyribonuclease V subunit beta n=1 Tax=Rubrivivax sp. A210 TaxID=2772301 RepID=UPI00191AA9C3|nr:exodeoxyribonuclease V subunit beta [Rubrivivax sp. A210]CAD5371683.1 RecBCD enzyme subunit RecB [Rubrivivax sp. A210]